jgi:hypothetical protein
MNFKSIKISNKPRLLITCIGKGNETFGLTSPVDADPNTVKIVADYVDSITNDDGDIFDPQHMNVSRVTPTHTLLC